VGEGKRFFFEKKKQKTFGFGLRICPAFGETLKEIVSPVYDKSCLGLFFKEEPISPDCHALAHCARTF
jgi:hypothetical protein